jgi:hypothetical protein
LSAQVRRADTLWFQEGQIAHINDDHLFQGAALTQIAEHPAFTAINAFGSGFRSRSAFRINDDIGVFIKYASAPNQSHDEYIFTFSRMHLNELDEIARRCSKVVLALVCVKDKEICALSLDDFRVHIARRREAAEVEEDQYTLLVVAPKGQRLRVYMNHPGRRKVSMEQQVVARSDFPDVLFD